MADLGGKPEAGRRRPVPAAVEPVPDALPLLAGSWLVPPGAAYAVSLRHRPGCEELTMAWAALTGSAP